MLTCCSRELERFTLVCGNRSKVAEAERLTGSRFKRASLAIEEIQAETCQAVAEAKARSAARELGADVIVEDVSLSITALRGFPGPFVKFWCERAGGVEAMCRAIDFSSDRSATVSCALVAERFAGASMTATGELRGVISLQPRCHAGFGFDSIFCPAGFDGMTLAELSAEQRDSVSHRSRAWAELIALLHRSHCCC